MSNAGHVRSDALVFFGATGDLAYKKIFPTLYAMTKRGTLGVPVIGVAFSNWSLDDLKKRAHDSITEHHLRPLTKQACWRRQRRAWKALLAERSAE